MRTIFEDNEFVDCQQCLFFSEICSPASEDFNLPCEAYRNVAFVEEPSGELTYH